MNEMLTIGHSARPLWEFIALLTAHGITHVVDVRRVARVRLAPQFNRDLLPAQPGAAGIRYAHMPQLSPIPGACNGSPHRRLASAARDGFPDHMQTPQFAADIDTLLHDAGNARIAIMYLEALPWRCHRSLIADALTVRGLIVGHIMNATLRLPHVLTPWAVTDGMRIRYRRCLAPSRSATRGRPHEVLMHLPGQRNGSGID